MKKFKSVFVLWLVVIFTVTACSSNCKTTKESYSGGEVKHSKTYSVNPGGKLKIDLETGSDITVEGWDRDEVKIEVWFKGSSADEIEVSFNHADDFVKVSSEYTGDRKTYKTTGKFIAKVPKKFDVYFHTMGGDVKLSDLSGSLEGKTMGGDLLMKKLTGNASLKTMGGDINLSYSELDGSVTTMGGDVEMEYVEGSVDVKTMGGDIIHKNVTSGNSSSEINIKTMGGAIKVDEALNGAKVKTMGGDIEVISVRKFLNATTMGGDIDVKAADAKVYCKTMGGAINVKVTSDADADGKDIKLKSMHGEVYLMVPEGFSMDVDVKIRMTKSDVGEFGINGLKLDEEVKEDYGNNGTSDGEPMDRILVGKKSFNGGKNKVVISTVRSNVKIVEY